MSNEFEKNLEKYAEVILKIGLNFQLKQRLLIGSLGSFSEGAPFEAAPLIRIITKKAYQMGARLVDVIWGDEELRYIRLKYSSRKYFRELPKWKIDARFDISKAGDAHLLILSPKPDLLKDIPTGLILKYQYFLIKKNKPAMKLTQDNALTWSGITVPNKAWAKRLFPELSGDKGIERLWNLIFEICRINNEDPVSTWHSHNENLSKKCSYLNKKQYKKLRFRSQETDLAIGLPKHHIWKGGAVSSQKGIRFTPNLPTEEIFTLPDRNKVEGRVKITKPFIIEGQIIEGCILDFSEGRIITATAEFGEKFLYSILEVDEGTKRLGEVALVPNSSPISKADLVFYETLIDENAASHIAIGQAFKGCLPGGTELSEEEFLAAGGNNSLIHLDMMIGSSDMDVDGITEKNQIEPIMKKGEWAFKV